LQCAGEHQGQLGDADYDERQSLEFVHVVLQTSETVRRFYRALQSGELYEDGAWAVFSKPHSAALAGAGAGPSSGGGPSSGNASSGGAGSRSGEACFK
jgi:hypothetical protein